MKQLLEAEIKNELNNQYSQIKNKCNINKDRNNALKKTLEIK